MPSEYSFISYNTWIFTCNCTINLFLYNGGMLMSISKVNMVIFFPQSNLGNVRESHLISAITVDIQNM